MEESKKRITLTIGNDTAVLTYSPESNGVRWVYPSRETDLLLAVCRLREIFILIPVYVRAGAAGAGAKKNGPSLSDYVIPSFLRNATFEMDRDAYNQGAIQGNVGDAEVFIPAKHAPAMIQKLSFDGPVAVRDGYCIGRLRRAHARSMKLRDVNFSLSFAAGFLDMARYNTGKRVMVPKFMELYLACFGIGLGAMPDPDKLDSVNRILQRRVFETADEPGAAELARGEASVAGAYFCLEPVVQAFDELSIVCDGRLVACVSGDFG